MSKEPYNWWTDPKNKEEVERLSWWDKPENQHTIEIPVAAIEEDGHYIIATKDKPHEYLGEELRAVAQGKNKEEATKKLFSMIRASHNYSEECRRNYQRFVPFRKGDWSHIGGKWFIIFGHFFSFRYGKNMKYGFYIPFTKLNISYANEWKQYRDFKKKNQ